MLGRGVTASTGPDGRPVITVTVGAVTVEVHTSTALWSYLTAWRTAAPLAGVLEGTHNQQ